MTLCNENAPILVNEEMGCNIWHMTVRAPEIATTARPGQFVHVKVPGRGAHILRRPFGVYLLLSGVSLLWPGKGKKA